MRRQTESQAIGRKGERWFENMLPRQWTFDRPREDIGIDGCVALGTPTEMGGLQFGVQIKSRKSWHVRDNSISVRLDHSAIRLWRSRTAPVLIVLYDAALDKGYFCWAHALPIWNSRLRDTPLQTIRSKAKSIVEHVSVDCVLSPSTWDRIEADVKSYFERFVETLEDHNITVAILPTLNTILESLRGLYIVQTRWDKAANAEEQGMLLLLEMTSHRDVIRSVSKLRTEYHFACKTVEELERFLATYRNRVGGCIENLDELMAENEGCVVRANHDGLTHLRPWCIETLFEFVIGLSAMVKEWPDEPTILN